MHVVATAGHVDHGKSTLVRALTGRDPDRLEEERRRGLTIELGFAWTTIPGAGEVAFVDVPGHQRFVATALAGVGSVPVALLVVAADDPWMPQAAEHLAALDALGVQHGLVIVTRADLADPGPALARAREEVDRTSLSGAPSVAVSARTGAGLDQLRRTLADVLVRVPEPDPGADVRLWVDRCFHVRGTGTVVTGTLPGGTVTVGDQLALVTDSGEQPVRVRGLQSLESDRVSVAGVARVALDLGGRAPEALGRGHALVTPDAYVASRVVDVELRPDAVPPERPLLHIGTAAFEVRVRRLGDRFARLQLERSVPLHVGDRVLLRDPGSRTVWGGTVRDPDPPPLRRRGAAASRARELAEHDGTLAAELSARGVAERVRLRRAGYAEGDLPVGTVVHGSWLVSPALADQLRRDLAEHVAAAGTDGLAPVSAARLLHLPDPALVSALVGSDVREVAGRLVAGAEMPERLEEALALLEEELAAAPFAAPSAERLRELRLGPRDLALLHREGRLLHVGDGIVLLPDAAEIAVGVLAGLDQPFSVSAARRALGTSRRVVLPLLAHLDRSGRTVRLADDTRRLRRPPDSIHG